VAWRLLFNYRFNSRYSLHLGLMLLHALTHYNTQVKHKLKPIAGLKPLQYGYDMVNTLELDCGDLGIAM